MAKKGQITAASIKEAAQAKKEAATAKAKAAKEKKDAAAKRAEQKATEEAARLALTPDDKRALEAELRAYIKSDGTGFIKDLSEEKKARAKNLMKQLGRKKMEYDLDILDKHYKQVGD